MLDVTALVRPTYAIYENPVGILTLDEFGGVLLRLAEIGYQVRAFSVPANAVGAKHRRQRVFIIGHAGRESLAWPQRAGEQSEKHAEPDGIVADAESPRGREKPRSISGSQEAERGEIQERRIRSKLGSSEYDVTHNGSETLADADSAGRREHMRPEPVEPQLSPIERDVRQSGEPESGIRRKTDDVSDWPHPLTTERIKDRAARLKALGNSVVPAQCYPFFEAIRKTIRGCR